MNENGLFYSLKSITLLKGFLQECLTKNTVRENRSALCLFVNDGILTLESAENLGNGNKKMRKSKPKLDNSHFLKEYLTEIYYG